MKRERGHACFRSVRSRTDSTATNVASANYDAFGSVSSSTGSPGQFRFTGEQWDATGLEYLRARYYDPLTGRFTGADTVQPNAQGTQGWNLYAYVANNPTTWVDSTGHVAAGAIPRAPAGGGATDSLAPYMVGARAAGALAGLGLRIRDALTYLGLVLSGAWTLVDMWQTVDAPNGKTRADCDQEKDECDAGCRGLPADAKQRRALCWAQCMDRYAGCIQSLH